MSTSSLLLALLLLAPTGHFPDAETCAGGQWYRRGQIIGAEAITVGGVRQASCGSEERRRVAFTDGAFVGGGQRQQRAFLVEMA